jgi:hypothetical protein
MDTPLSSVVDLEVYDKTGAKVRFGDIFKDEKVAMVFTREALNKCAETLAELIIFSYITRSFLLRGRIIFHASKRHLSVHFHSSAK